MMALVAFLLLNCPLQSIIPVGMVNRPPAAPAPLPARLPMQPTRPVLAYRLAPILPAGGIQGFVPWFRWRRPEENGIPQEDDNSVE